MFATRANRSSWFSYQLRQISKPPPSANPLTAARTGFFPRRWLNPMNPVGGWFMTADCAPVLGPRRDAFCSARSCPAQNAFSPAPVTTATSSVGSSSNHVKRLCPSQWASDGNELRCFSRLMVTKITPGLGKDNWKYFEFGGWECKDSAIFAAL